MQKLVTVVIATSSWNGGLHTEVIQASLDNAKLTENTVQLFAKRIISDKDDINVVFEDDMKSASVTVSDVWKTFTPVSKMKILVIEPIVAAELV